MSDQFDETQADADEDQELSSFPSFESGPDIAAETPPTGVRSPATREIDLNATAPVRGVAVAPGTPIPALVPVDSQSVETRGPLAEVHLSTVEAAVALQHIPNDQIHGVYEDADGVKRDALGHPFA